MKKRYSVLSVALFCILILGCSKSTVREPVPITKPDVASVSLTDDPEFDRDLMGEEIEFGRKAAKYELWNEAIFRWEKVVKADAENVQAFNNLAVAYEAIGDFERARAHYEKALEIDEDVTALRNNYKRFLHFYKRHMRNQERLEKAKAKASGDSQEESPVSAEKQPEAEAKPTEDKGAAEGSQKKEKTP